MYLSVGLLTRIQESEDKGVCTRAFWCLAKQNLDSVVINTKVGTVSLKSLLIKKSNTADPLCATT